MDIFQLDKLKLQRIPTTNYMIKYVPCMQNSSIKIHIWVHALLYM